MASKLVQKSFRFPQRVVEVLEREAQSTLGVNFNQYIQYIVLKKAEEAQDRDFPDGTHLYSKKELKEIENAMREADKEIKSGKIITLKSSEDIDEFFRKVENDEI